MRYDNVKLEPKFIEGFNAKEGNFQIPIVDVRRGKEDREQSEVMTKSSNGNHSKYIPAKWGYGKFGPKKY